VVSDIFVKLLPNPAEGNHHVIKGEGEKRRRVPSEPSPKKYARPVFKV
jgi:hypothetical protein